MPSVQEAIFNFIWYCFWMVFLCTVLRPRYALRTTAPVLLVAHIPYALLMTNLPFLSSTRGLAGPVFILVLTFCLFRDQWYRKLLALVCIVASVFLSELLIAGMLTREQIAGGIPSLEFPLQITIYLSYLFIGGVCLSIIAVLWKRFSTRYPWNLPFGGWLVFFLFPLSQYILVVGWIRSASLTGGGVLQAFFALLLCIGADLGMLAVLLRTGRTAMLEARSALLEEQLSFQKQYYTTLNEQYFTIRKLRHDIANHMTAIRQLLQNGVPGEAEQYADRLIAAQESSRSAVACANPTVAAFLTGKQQELKARGITLQPAVELPAEPGIPELDLITALGNLLDNAADACELSVDDKTISLTVAVQPPYILLTTENAAFPAVPKGRRIPELARGMGTQILEKLAKDYDGDFVLQKAERCTARLTLKEKAQ